MVSYKQYCREHKLYNLLGDKKSNTTNEFFSFLNGLYNDIDIYCEEEKFYIYEKSHFLAVYNKIFNFYITIYFNKMFNRFYISEYGGSHIRDISYGDYRENFIKEFIFDILDKKKDKIIEGFDYDKL